MTTRFPRTVFRRRLLKACGVAGIAGLAGCSANTNTTSPSPAESTTATTTQSTSTTDSITTEPESTQEPEIDTYHVAPSGSDSHPGTERHPLATLQTALSKAHPGDTIHVAPGAYHESNGPYNPVSTVRAGKPDAPITITGPPTAVLKAGKESAALRIKHSHIHLRGLTLDGLIDSSNPDKAESYARFMLLHIRPPDGGDYLQNIVAAPAGIGNSRRVLMLVKRTKHIEIGPFKVTGLAGADYVLGDATSHVGEIIYLGAPKVEFTNDTYPWETIDQTSHVHIHHIDNTAGHPHSELVNAKVGTHDVLVEYCTSTGRSQNTEPYPPSEIRFESYDATLRWCDLRHGDGYGVHVFGKDPDPVPETYDPERTTEQRGSNHQIYGNHFEDFAEGAFAVTTPDIQGPICGNNIEGPTGNAPNVACDANLPQGDGIGHLGGNSPWV